MNGSQIAAKAATQTTVISRRSKSDTRRETGFALIMWGALAIIALAISVLLFTIVVDGLPRFSMDLFTNQPSKVRPETSGVQSAIIGTLYLMVLTAAFVIPIGIATAVYLEEYADKTKWFNRFIELNIQNLA
ncbi:MAG: hypothetical protein JHC98_12515, partial [Thermoleophilaceae bacterium]|nr:hypothetical protein [Thermoleophilaceae bacterium]